MKTYVAILIGLTVCFGELVLMPALIIYAIVPIAACLSER